jgi:hypothetical protein
MPGVLTDQQNDRHWQASLPAPCRFDAQRIEGWLKCKVRQTQDCLRVHCPSSLPQADLDATAYAAGVVSEYLDNSWSQHLLQVLGLSASAGAMKHVEDDTTSHVAMYEQENLRKKAKVRGVCYDEQTHFH